MTATTTSPPLSGDALDDLRERTHGVVLTPDDDGYDDARAVWNAMIDRYPALFVRVRGAGDVATAIAFAREHDLEVAVKGGGHNVAGNAVCDDGLVIDCGTLDDVHVDPDANTALVGAGATLADVDAETQAHGLATPVGFISLTGIAGLTLGGGIGYLSRRDGLTVDNLRAVRLVTADGEYVRATESNHEDLFWAVRGGGGNFGVVTAFEFDLHELGPTVLGGPMAWSFEDAPTVLRELQAVMRDAPDEVACLPVLRHAPPAPFLPEDVHGDRILVVSCFYAGDGPEAERALAPIRDIGEPVADAVQPLPYTGLQSLFDGTADAGARNYWKSHYLPALSDEAIDVLCTHARGLTSPESAIGMLSLGGAVARESDAATPYPHRDARWVVNVQARWRDPDEDDRHVAWTRDVYEDLAPHATGGVYVNFVDRDEGVDRVRAAYGEDHYERLARVKAQWDPENVFHRNQNVVPAD